MPIPRLNFTQWRELARQSPERVIDQFAAKLGMLAPENRRAIIAALPDKSTLIQSLQAACALSEQPLSGVPYLLQDLFDVQDLPTVCGAPFNSPFDAPLEDSSLLYQKLKTLGASFFAKTVPSEFGIDPQGRNATFGNCPHAEGLHLVAGGGAGASARAVSEGLAPLAFGLDSGGGIRIPAAFHGLFGFRMGNNAYARDGVFPIVPSLESVGWVTACIEDLNATFHAFHKVSTEASLDEPRGYLLQGFSAALSPEIKSGIMQLARELNIDEDAAMNTRLCHELRDAGKAYRTIQNRALYSIHQYWIEEYRERYDAALLERIEQGKNCTIAMAEECEEIENRIRTALSEFFHDYDYLILPISPQVNPTKADWCDTLENELIHLIAPASLAFLPAIILPIPLDHGRHSAAQIIISPRKLHIVPELLAQVTGYYEN